MEIVEENTKQIEQEQPVKKKRGRKPSKEKFYFGEKEENAVIDYIHYTKLISNTTKKMLLMTFDCTSEEFDVMFSGRTLYDIIEIANNVTIEDRNKLYQISELKNEIENAKIANNTIYNTILKPAFKKMIESIMRRYKLYVPCEESGQTFSDTLSFLLTKAEKFEEEKNKKAYSYYGNICKNYIIGRIQTYNKSLIRNPSYDSEENEIDIINDNRYAIKTDRGSKIATEIVDKLIERFNEMSDNPEKYDLRENEVKLGKALANLLDNWDYVISTDGSNKLNKNAILFFLREQTGLDTKGIRDNMKKFKKEFLIIKKYVIG